MHNKMFVADNAAAVIGGRNLGNEYFGEKADAGFIDLDVLVAGPVVRDASTSFDAYWASEWVVPIEAFRPVRPTAEEVDAVLGSLRDAGRRLRDSEYGERIRASTLFAEVRDGSVDLLWAPATAIADRPDKLLGGSTTESVIRTELRPHLKSAQREVFLVSPYFVPGNDGVATLRELAAKGLRVRVLTNSLAGTDLAAVYAGYSRYQVPLLEAGVELYELRPVGGSADAQERLAEALGAERATLHAKTFVVDGRYVFIGSMNLDPRSDRINTEFGILFDSTALAERLLSSLRWLVEPARSYRLALEDGRVTWTSEQDGRQRRSVDIPDASVGRRLALPLLRALAPESLL
jgi:putative cardiolipin synthase